LARYAIGTKAHGCKLTDKTVLDIKELKGKMSQDKIGKIYGIGQTQVGRILRGERWRHLNKAGSV
jgi:hypothetical protein